MMVSNSHLVSLAVIALSPFLSQVRAQVTTNCPLLGPAFPAPTGLAALPAIQSAQASFPGILQEALANELPDNVTTSFSINIFSGYDDVSIFNYHYAAPGLNGSLPSGTLDNNTVYRLGSMSKLLTAYTFLDQVGFSSFQDPITKWIPELAAIANATKSDAVNNITWCDITIEALMSHLAGIPRDYALLDFANDNLPLASLGLPNLTESQIPQCGLNVGLPLCTRAEYFQGLATVHPVTAPFETAIYSNVGFTLLAYAIEAITGKSFDVAFNTSIVQGLGLSGTSLAAPNISNVIIPIDSDSSFWSIDAGNEEAAGGMYSNTNDMTAIGQSILRSTLLSPADTRKWMKPKAHTADVMNSVGSPWEIVRMNVPISNSSNITRVVDLYTKAGDLGLYSSLLVIDADHNTGFSILAAGEATTAMVEALAGVISATFLPAFEEAARESAVAAFAGTYVVNGTDSSSNLTLTADGSRPGIGVSQWFSNGVDMSETIKTLYGITEADIFESIRLYPVGLTNGDQISFRAVFDTLPKPASTSSFSGTCESWVLVDGLLYGSRGLDEFLFEIDGQSGKAQAVSARALRERLVRT